MDVTTADRRGHRSGGGLVGAVCLVLWMAGMPQLTSAASLGGVTTSLFADTFAKSPVLPAFIDTDFTLPNGAIGGQPAGNGQNWSTSGGGMDVKNGAVETAKNDVGTAYVLATGVTRIEVTVGIAKDGVAGIITDGDGISNWVGLLVVEASDEVRLVRSIAGIQTTLASIVDGSASHRLVLVETPTGYSASVNGVLVGTALLGLTLRTEIVGMYADSGNPKSDLDDFLAV